MAHGLVRDREFAEVMADHLGLDLDAVEYLAVVDAHDAADHLGHDDHVSQVRLHGLGLVHGPAGLFRPAQSGYEALGLCLEPAVDAAARARVDELGELLVVQVEKLLELDAAEQELAEGALLAERGRTLHLGLVHGSGAQSALHLRTRGACPPRLGLIRVPREWAAHGDKLADDTRGRVCLCSRAHASARSRSKK